MDYVEFLLLGLGVGALYALTGQGLVLIYRGAGVVNFAQGAIGMIGAFAFYELRDEWEWPTAASLVASLAVCAAIGVLVHLLVMRQLRHASSLVRLVATLGIFFLLLAVGVKIWGSNVAPVRSPFPETVRHPFSDQIAIPEFRFWILGLAVVVTFVLWLLYTRTQFGRATDAVAESPLSAAAMGVSPDVVSAVNWGLGSILAGVTGILIAPILFLSVTAISFTVLRGLAAALLGGFRSFWLTLAGALGIGVAEAELGFHYSDNPGIARSVAFLVIVVVMVVGGQSLPLRTEILDRMPRLGSGRVSPTALVVAAGATVFALLQAPSDWVGPITITLGVAVVCLSLVVLTGFVGQLSLAQFSLAGLGAWAAGRFTVETGAPFPLALVVGIAVAVPVGLLVALPALRTRGVNLAVITFGLAVVIFEMVLNDPDLTGGLGGTNVGHPHLFGIDVNGVGEPRRYGIVVLGALVIAGLVVANLRRSRIGRKLIAVRANERGAAALGISVYGVKLYAFALATALAALGGILLAFRQEVISYLAFSPFSSVQVVVFAVVGGIGYVLGAPLGATLAVGGLGGRLLGAAGGYEDWLEVASGALLVGILLVEPNGLADAVSRAARRVRVTGRRRAARAPGPPLPAPGAVARPEVRPLDLAVDGLTVRFGATAAADDVSFTVAPGEVLGLIGPNGAGKTTVIDAVSGFLSPAAGTVRLGGEDVSRLGPRRLSRRGLGRAFQSLELFEDMTVRQNLQVAADRVGRLDWLTDLVWPRTAPLPPGAVVAVHEFGLAVELDQEPDQISYGHRRLTAIARAVAAGPSVLLLDEPAAGLGEAESRDLGELILRMAKEWGLAVLLVEHDVSLVASVCDRVVVLDFGRVIAEGPTAEVLTNDVVRAAYLGDRADAEGAAGPAGADDLQGAVR